MSAGGSCSCATTLNPHKPSEAKSDLHEHQAGPGLELITHLSAFLAVSVMVIVTPGPDTALTIRNSLIGGRAGGIFTAVGVGTGQATWALATSLGITALLRVSEPVFVGVKVIGAAYLVVLGVQGVCAALGFRAPHEAANNAAPNRLGRPGVAFRQGLISNLGNPKMAVFFTSMLPQFVPHGRASFLALLLLGLVFCLMTIIWLTAYAFGVARVGDVLRRSRVRRTVDGLTGAVLIALGLRLAAAHR